MGPSAGGEPLEEGQFTLAGSVGKKLGLAYPAFTLLLLSDSGAFYQIKITRRQRTRLSERSIEPLSARRQSLMEMKEAHWEGQMDPFNTAC